MIEEEVNMSGKRSKTRNNLLKKLLKTPSSQEIRFLTEEELYKILISFANNRKKDKKQFTLYEATTVLKWCDKTRFRDMALNMVLDGDLLINLEAGEEVTFEAVK